MPLIAKVRFSSPLPQLDKEFDYLVPASIAKDLQFGQLVEVPFGAGGKLKTGVVCDVLEVDLPRDKLLEVQSRVSAFKVFTQTQFELCQAVAQRQAGTVGELLTVSIPKRFVRVETKFNPLQQPNADDVQRFESSTLVQALKDHSRIYYQPRLLDGSSSVTDWAANFVASCHSMLLEGKSSLVVLPDFAELSKFEAALANQNLMQVSIRHASSDSGSARYFNHLKSINSVAINYGLRSAAFSPATNLGLILLWDDGDESHIEQSSPYWISREVLLQRAELEKAKIVLASHSPSTEAVRLVEIQHLAHVSGVAESADVLVTSLTDRLDSQTFALISDSLKTGKPVLVQIANAGWASGLLCIGCKELRTCPNCSASIWIDPAGKIRCRSCKLHLEQSPCSCGKTATRPTKIGASAFTKQMERSFPNVSVVHSNGDERLLSVKSGPLLVVSTPGAEPVVDGGYSCVVIADAPGMVGSPRLRALEQSLGKWANAISLANSESTIVFAGLVGELSEHMHKLDFYASVQDDFADRQDLGLPPVTRIASVVSSNPIDHQRLVDKLRMDLTSEKVRTLGVAQANTLVFDYSYSYGLELADLLKDVTQKLSASSKSKKPGERVYRINMDDGKVI